MTGIGREKKARIITFKSFPHARLRNSYFGILLLSTKKKNERFRSRRVFPSYPLAHAKSESQKHLIFNEDLPRSRLFCGHPVFFPYSISDGRQNGASNDVALTKKDEKRVETYSWLIPASFGVRAAGTPSGTVCKGWQ